MTTLDSAISALLGAREDDHWRGELSSSALSTATACIALWLADRSAKNQTHQELINDGIAWLLRTQNADGGWGDTTQSFSNISTTALCWAALGVAGTEEKIAAAESAAADWLRRAAGSLEPDNLARAVTARYGKDRSFSVPILTVLALAGKLGVGRESWLRVPQLPFELAACPPSWFNRLKLPVVSYALPALIAIGQARHHQ